MPLLPQGWATITMTKELVSYLNVQEPLSRRVGQHGEACLLLRESAVVQRTFKINVYFGWFCVSFRNMSRSLSEVVGMVKSAFSALFSVCPAPHKRSAFIQKKHSP